MSPRVLLTGASGCIGHYIAEALIRETDCELYLFVRNPDKLNLDLDARSGVTVVAGDLQRIQQFGDLLQTIDVPILTAACWGGMPETFDINLSKTLQLLNLLDSDRVEQVLYFSTASVLDRQNQLLKAAGELGTDYIRSKYACAKQLARLKLAPKITALYPTLVFGGDDRKPRSHLTSGLAEVMNYAGWITRFQTDASFHFIHGRDIAQVVRHLVQHPPAEPGPRHYVLGNPSLTANEAIAAIGRYTGRRSRLKIPLSIPLANVLIDLFRIQMAPWDRFCLRYRHFTYENPLHPAVLGLETRYPTLESVLADAGGTVSVEQPG